MISVGDKKHNKFTTAKKEGPRKRVQAIRWQAMRGASICEPRNRIIEDTPASSAAARASASTTNKAGR
jgi:hypothetical protein